MFFDISEISYMYHRSYIIIYNRAKEPDEFLQFDRYPLKPSEPRFEVEEETKLLLRSTKLGRYKGGSIVMAMGVSIVMGYPQFFWMVYKCLYLENGSIAG